MTAAEEEPEERAGSVTRWLGLYGPLLLALYFIAATRWGSFLLPGPPYIGDIVLGGLIALRVWTLARGRGPEPLLSRWPTILAGALLLLSVLALAKGDQSVDGLRDGAPYFYAVLVFFGQSYRGIPERIAERLVYAALIFHAVWFSVAEFIPDAIGTTTPGDDEVFIFGIRPDIDGAMLGVLIALAFDRLMTGREQLLSSAIAAWALTLVLLTQSRASLLATLAAILFMAIRWVALRRSGVVLTEPGTNEGSRPALSGLAASVAVIAVLLAVPSALTATSGLPDALERSVNVVTSATGRDVVDRDRGGSGDSGGGGRAGDGRRGDREEGLGDREEDELPPELGVATFEARLAGWEEVVDWLADDDADRFVFGAGFGPHYLQLSGADVAFFGPEADPSIRATHNYGLNTWARLGLVGLLVAIAIAGLALVAAFRLAVREAAPPILDLLAGLLVVGIPVTALLGVVLESPFGAIPYFWAVGYLSARMVQEGLWRPLPIPARLRPDEG